MRRPLEPCHLTASTDRHGLVHVGTGLCRVEWQIDQPDSNAKTKSLQGMEHRSVKCFKLLPRPALYVHLF
jgi:GH24 family phage-related lysozyme (muramidase)